MSPLLALPLITGCALALAACSKKEAPVSVAPPATPTSETDAASARPLEGEPAVPAPAPAAKPLSGPVHTFMTSQLRIFIQEKGRLPTDFGEFAQTRLDSVPRAPEGRKWDIDLATQEVKLVEDK